MSIGSTLKIGTDTLDIAKPCDVVTVLKKIQLKLAAGSLRDTVRIDGEEVRFQGANDSRLVGLIRQYEADCARASGGTVQRTRFAKRFRFT